MDNQTGARDTSHLCANQDVIMHELQDFRKEVMGEFARLQPATPIVSGRGKEAAGSRLSPPSSQEQRPAQNVATALLTGGNAKTRIANHVMSYMRSMLMLDLFQETEPMESDSQEDVAEEPTCPICPDYADTKEHAAALQGRVTMLENELGKARALWEESRANNVDLTKQIADRSEKLSNVQKFLARSGRAQKGLMDADIKQKFITFKSDIHQYVKDHVEFSKQPRRPGMKGELEEALTRCEIANMLHAHLFVPEGLPLGVEDHLLEGSPLRWYQSHLLANNCDEALLRDWRVATVKANRCLNPNFDFLSEKVAERIWNHLICHYTEPGSLKTAQRDLVQLCRTASELAFLFSASNIEYRWEQCTIPEDRAVRPGDYDVVAVQGNAVAGEGANQDQGELEIMCIVFGGVARGDKRTGLLADGRVSLNRPQVTARRRQRSSPE